MVMRPSVLEDREVGIKAFKMLMSWAKASFEQAAGDHFSSLLSGKVCMLENVTKQEALAVIQQVSFIPGIDAGGFQVAMRVG
jgi:hypothetical protein